MKKVLCLLFVSILSPSNSNECLCLNKKNAIQPFSANNHQTIDGFQWNYGFVNPLLKRYNYGYFYYDMEVYFTQFTSHSRLYILHNKCDFTPASVAIANDEDGFSSGYHLESAYIHTKVFRKLLNDKVSSSFYYKGCTPQSDSFTTSFTTSSGFNLALNPTIKAGVNITDGVYLSGSVASLELKFNKELTIYSKEPYLSQSMSPSDMYQSQWNIKYNSVGKVTYTLDTFYFFELKDDGNGYQDYSFGFETNIQMITIKDKGWVWNKRQKLDYTYNGEYGLY